MLNTVLKLQGWVPETKAKFETVDEAARVFLTRATVVAGLIAVAVLIYGGISYIISTGDENKTQKAQKTIMYGLVGLVIVGVAFLLVRFILNIMGMSPEPIDQG